MQTSLSSQLSNGEVNHLAITAGIDKEAFLKERAGALWPEHAALIFEESRIGPAVAGERMYCSIDKAESRYFGYQSKQAGDGLLVPIWGVDGKLRGSQLRRNQPRANAKGRPIKYETPYGQSPTIDCPPRFQAQLRDPAVTLYCTEGCRKADAMAARGYLCISVSGVWAWRGTNECGGTMTLGDWDMIALNGRKVVLGFDSDVVAKREVAAALRRFRAFLERKDADVYLIDWSLANGQ